MKSFETSLYAFKVVFIKRNMILDKLDKNLWPFWGLVNGSINVCTEFEPDRVNISFQNKNN